MSRLVSIALPLVLALASMLPPAAAQPGKSEYRIAFLATGSAPSPLLPNFLRELSKLGYVEGRNLRVESRYGDANRDRLAAHAGELAASQPDLILAGGTFAALAAKQATFSIPVLFNVGDDPVRRGLVVSLARPGGNLTGFTIGLYEEKRMQILAEAMPGMRRVARLRDANDGGRPDRRLAQALGMQIQTLRLRGPEDLEKAFSAAVRGRAEGIVVEDLPWTLSHVERIAALAMRHRLPAIGFDRRFAVAGGLMYYGPKPGQNGPRLAAQADRIFKGAKPSQLPVEQPRLFELVINESAARELKLRIAQSVLLRADEIIR